MRKRDYFFDFERDLKHNFGAELLDNTKIMLSNHKSNIILVLLWTR